MEGDHVKKDKKEAKSLKGSIIDARNVLFTIWVRLPIQATHGANWIILDSRRYFLWDFRLFLCLVYIAFQAIKSF
jgi:hypothetical protein